MQRARSLGILAVLLALVALAPIGLAANTLSINAEVHTFNITIVKPIFNKSITIAANGTYTINVTLPKNWTSKDVAAIHVVAEGVTNQFTLAAKAGNGTTLATGTVVPLSSGWQMTLPPETSKIELSTTNAANATIIVYVQSDPVTFKVSLDQNSVSLKIGDTAWVHGSITQTSGPPVFLWGKIEVTNPLKANAYWGTYNTGDVPPSNSDIGNSQYTDGANWTGKFSIFLDATSLTEKDKGTYKVTLLFYASPDYGEESTNAQLVATVNLAGTLSNDGFLNLNTSNVDAKSVGIGAVVALVFALVFMGHGGKHGRRRGTAPGASILIILVLIAAIGLAAGLIDIQTRWNLDPKMLGVGILAMLALILLIRQGTVPAPRIVRKIVG